MALDFNPNRIADAQPLPHELIDENAVPYDPHQLTKHLAGQDPFGNPIPQPHEPTEAEILAKKEQLRVAPAQPLPPTHIEHYPGRISSAATAIRGAFSVFRKGGVKKLREQRQYNLDHYDVIVSEAARKTVEGESGIHSPYTGEVMRPDEVGNWGRHLIDKKRESFVARVTKPIAPNPSRPVTRHEISAVRRLQKLNAKIAVDRTSRDWLANSLGDSLNKGKYELSRGEKRNAFKASRGSLIDRAIDPGMHGLTRRDAKRVKKFNKIATGQDIRRKYLY